MGTNRRNRILGRSVLTLAMALAATISGTAGTRAVADTEIVAHNGGTAWGPESTLASFGHDIDVEATGIEFAVRFTRDGVPVVIHDATLNRTTNCTGYVADHTFAQLQRCDAGVRFARRFRGARIPSLDQALTYICRRSASITLFIHVKENDGGQIRTLIKDLDHHGVNTNRTTLIGSTPSILATMRAAGAHRLGYVFNNASGWASNYPVLIPYNAPINRADVERAQHRGQEVLPVQGHPATLTHMSDLGTTGVLADDVDAAISVARGETPRTAGAHHPATAPSEHSDHHRRSGGGGGGGF
jgi:glycerophosphoryl diester phosphodiesterase